MNTANEKCEFGVLTLKDLKEKGYDRTGVVFREYFQKVTDDKGETVKLDRLDSDIVYFDPIDLIEDHKTIKDIVGSVADTVNEEPVEDIPDNLVISIVATTLDIDFESDGIMQDMELTLDQSPELSTLAVKKVTGIIEYTERDSVNKTTPDEDSAVIMITNNIVTIVTSEGETSVKRNVKD